MTLHCSRAGFSPEIDWPTECHADPGVSGVFQSMALEYIWCCTATCILNWIWCRVETMWIRCMVINESHIEQGHSDSHEFECRAITWVGSLAVASDLNSKIIRDFWPRKLQLPTWPTPRCSTRSWPSALGTSHKRSRYQAGGPSLGMRPTNAFCLVSKEMSNWVTGSLWRWPQCRRSNSDWKRRLLRASWPSKRRPGRWCWPSLWGVQWSMWTWPHQSVEKWTTPSHTRSVAVCFPAAIDLLLCYLSCINRKAWHCQPWGYGFWFDCWTNAPVHAVMFLSFPLVFRFISLPNSFDWGLAVGRSRTTRPWQHCGAKCDIIWRTWGCTLSLTSRQPISRTWRSKSRAATQRSPRWLPSPTNLSRNLHQSQLPRAMCWRGQLARLWWRFTLRSDPAQRHKSLLKTFFDCWHCLRSGM